MAIPSHAVPVRAGGELRERVAAGNQLFLCGVVGVLFVTGVLTGSLTDAGLFGIGVLLVVAGGVAALAVPWSRLPPYAVAFVPIIDIVGIALLREADTTAGMGLLWVLPAIWLASIGRVGFVIAAVGIPLLYWAILLLGSTPRGTYSFVLLPVILAAVSATTYASARRYSAQRLLLDRQTERISAAHRGALHQEQLVSEVLDTVDFGVIRLSPAGDVVLENDALVRFLDIPGLVPGGAPDAVVLDELREPLPAAQHPVERLRRGESFVDVVVWFERRGAADIALSFTGRRLVDHRGEDVGAVLVTRDVTTEREAQRARDELVASVSHELRTPLTSVLGFLELALDGDDLPDKARGQIETAYRNSERLLDIVGDILAASSRSNASIETRLHRQRSDVTEIARASLIGLAPLADDRIVAIELAREEPVEAFVDPARIRQVLDNLIINAIKFNRDGGTVTVTTSTDGVHTVIRVADTGIGMSAESASRAFERFFRASPTTPGNGLGLPITLDIVEAHGGTVSIESEPGEGSVFTVVLPSTEAVADREAAARRDGEGDIR